MVEAHPGSGSAPGPPTRCAGTPRSSPAAPPPARTGAPGAGGCGRVGQRSQARSSHAPICASCSASSSSNGVSARLSSALGSSSGTPRVPSSAGDRSSVPTTWGRVCHGRPVDVSAGAEESEAQHVVDVVLARTGGLPLRGAGGVAEHRREHRVERGEVGDVVHQRDPGGPVEPGQVGRAEAEGLGERAQRGERHGHPGAAQPLSEPDGERGAVDRRGAAGPAPPSTGHPNP